MAFNRADFVNRVTLTRALLPAPIRVTLTLFPLCRLGNGVTLTLLLAARHHLSHIDVNLLHAASYYGVTLAIWDQTMLESKLSDLFFAKFMCDHESIWKT